jgi:pimeloyl-ACP methyl ester carboxylesterase
MIRGQRLEPLQLRDIMCPVMVTSSDYDPFFSKDTLREVAQLIGPSGATIIHFPGHGHSVRGLYKDNLCFCHLPHAVSIS